MKKTLGIITNNQYGVFQQTVIAGVRQIASPNGYDVVVESRDTPDTYFKIEDMAGILVIANPVPNEYVQKIYESGIPISLVSHQIEDLPIPAVTSNNLQGIATLVRHLIACERRKFVFIRGHIDQNDGIERENAFRRELMRYNLDLPDTHFIRGDFDPDIAAQSLRDFLGLGLDFDAVIATDFLMAKATIQVLSENGFGVPKEVSVVGFGDGPEAAAAGITTVAADVVELGRRSARQLIGQLRGLRIQGTTVLSVELILRDTCNASEELRTHYAQHHLALTPLL